MSRKSFVAGESSPVPSFAEFVYRSGQLKQDQFLKPSKPKKSTKPEKNAESDDSKNLGPLKKLNAKVDKVVSDYGAGAEIDFDDEMKKIINEALEIVLLNRPEVPTVLNRPLKKNPDREKNFTIYSHALYIMARCYYEIVVGFEEKDKEVGSLFFQQYQDYVNKAMVCILLSMQITDHPLLREIFSNIKKEINPPLYPSEAKENSQENLPKAEEENVLSAFELELVPAIEQQNMLQEFEKAQQLLPGKNKNKTDDSKQWKKEEYESSILDKIIYKRARQKDKGNLLQRLSQANYVESVNRSVLHGSRKSKDLKKNEMDSGRDFTQIMEEIIGICSCYDDLTLEEIRNLPPVEKEAAAHAFRLKGAACYGLGYYFLKDPELQGNFSLSKELFLMADECLDKSYSLSKSRVVFRNLDKAENAAIIFGSDIKEVVSFLENDEEKEQEGQDAPEPEDQPQSTSQNSAGESQPQLTESVANMQQSVELLLKLESKDGEHEEDNDEQPGQPLYSDQIHQSSESPTSNNSDPFQRIRELEAKLVEQQMEMAEQNRKKDEGLAKEKEVFLKAQEEIALNEQQEKEVEKAKMNEKAQKLRNEEERLRKLKSAMDREHSVLDELSNAMEEKEQELTTQEQKAQEILREANEEQKNAKRMMQNVTREQEIANEKQAELEKQERNLERGRDGLNKAKNEFAIQQKKEKEWEEGIVKEREKSEQKLKKLSEQESAAANQKQQEAEAMMKKATEMMEKMEAKQESEVNEKVAAKNKLLEQQEELDAQRIAQEAAFKQQNEQLVKKEEASNKELADKKRTLDEMIEKQKIEGMAKMQQLELEREREKRIAEQEKQAEIEHQVELAKNAMVRLIEEKEEELNNLKKKGQEELKEELIRQKKEARDQIKIMAKGYFEWQKDLNEREQSVSQREDLEAELEDLKQQLSLLQAMKTCDLEARKMANVIMQQTRQNEQYLRFQETRIGQLYQVLQKDNQISQGRVGRPHNPCNSNEYQRPSRSTKPAGGKRLKQQTNQSEK
ncbi:MAG: hypothetical protein K0R25_397 [Rickettsiaceae bacterium]|jgi:hypothetical protein|nr:hypothetical protein [Rickettsiaceae bacterium]